MAVAAVRVESEFLTPTPFIPPKQVNPHSSPCDVTLLDFFDGEISSPADKFPPFTTDIPSDEQRLHKLLNEPEPVDDCTYDPEFVAARLAILLGDTPDELLDGPFHWLPPSAAPIFSLSPATPEIELLSPSEINSTIATEKTITFALELEGHTALSLGLAASDLAERERPAKLKAARKYNGNLHKFRWASYQLLGRPDKGSKVSCDDSCSLYTAPPFRFGYVIRDDFYLNDTQVYGGAVVSTIDVSASEEPLKPLETVRSRHKPRHGGRVHGRPPDHGGATKILASAFEATSNGISVRLSLALPHHSSVLDSARPLRTKLDSPCPVSTLAAIPRRRGGHPDVFSSGQPHRGGYLRTKKMPDA